MHIYETKHPVAHSADDMFALVARVEDYPKFLPLCEELTVTRREQVEGKEVLIAAMTVGYGMIHETFTTRVHLDRGARTILVEYLDGPFTFLENRWHFRPFGTDVSEVQFYIAYAKGFLMVSASPLTRSSHHAGEDFARLKAARSARI